MSHKTLSKLARLGEDSRPAVSGRTRGATAWLVVGGISALLLGCASSSPTCSELEVLADRQGCPERIIRETVETFDAGELLERLGPIPEPPPYTAAELEDPTVAEGLSAVLEDLKAFRTWGLELFDQLKDLERAIRELEPDTP